MSLAIGLVSLNTKLLNLMKVAAMCNLQNFRLDVVFCEGIKYTQRQF
jgi:hypothetical protein